MGKGKYLKVFSILVLLTALIYGFQNCSEVGVGKLASNGGTNKTPPPPPPPGAVCDLLVTSSGAASALTMTVPASTTTYGYAWNYASGTLPTGAKAYWMGTRNGSPDIVAGAQPQSLASNSTGNIYTNPGTPSIVGTYVRYLVINDVNNNLWCQSNNVTVILSAATVYTGPVNCPAPIGAHSTVAAMVAYATSISFGSCIKASDGEVFPYTGFGPCLVCTKGP